MKFHVIAAAVATVAVLLFCAATGPIDRGADRVKWKEVRATAQQQAKARLKSGEVWR